MRIRYFEHGDVEQWFDLLLQLWPDSSREDLEFALANIKRNPPTLAVFVATEEASLIGFIEVSTRDWADGCSTRNVGYIEGWFVRPETRRKGVGGRLVKAAEQWAITQGCREMGSDTEIENETSRASLTRYVEKSQLAVFGKRIAQ
ncbi:MAG TPA: GNAT family N-acetyltransferase [Bacteroidota bacterium]